MRRIVAVLLLATRAAALRRRDRADEDADRRRVAVAFWGINRSLDKCWPSIKARILKPLERVGAVSVFFHTFDVKTASQLLGGVAAVPGAAPELALFRNQTNLVAWEVEDQAAFDATADFRAFLRARRANRLYDDATVRNLVRALHSLRAVTEIWTAHGPFDAVVYVRPDMHFATPIDAARVAALGPRELLTVDWGRDGGLNDRFAAGGPVAAAKFGRRLEKLGAYVASGLAIHAERFSYWAVSEMSWSVSSSPCGVRVRPDGSTPRYEEYVPCFDAAAAEPALPPASPESPPVDAAATEPALPPAGVESPPVEAAAAESPSPARSLVAEDASEAGTEEKKEEEEEDAPIEDPGAIRGDPGVDAVLVHLGLSALIPRFAEQLIDAATLPLLTVDDLQTMAVPPAAARAIVEAVRAPAKKVVTLNQEESFKVAVHQSKIEGELADHRADLARLRHVLARRRVPESYMCPISCEIMLDPIVAADGHTYERRCIEEWLATGARTSPATNAPLAHLNLTPSHAFKSLITEFLEEMRELETALGDEVKS